MVVARLALLFKYGLWLCFSLIGILGKGVLYGEIPFESDEISRARLYLLLNDPDEALKQIQSVDVKSSIPALKTWMHVLSSQEDVVSLLDSWHTLVSLYPEKAYDQDVLELLAWTILSEGFKDSSWTHQITSMIGAAWVQDAKSIRFLNQGLRSSNQIVRFVAVGLMRGYRDQQLIDSLTLILQDSSSGVDMMCSALDVIGSHHLVELLPLVRSVLDNKGLSWDVYLVAASVYIDLLDSSHDDNFFEEELKSPYAPLRFVVCRSMAVLQEARYAPFLLELTQDEHYMVRLAAWQALGDLGITGIEQQLRDKPFDNHVDVAMRQAWVLALYGISSGSEYLLDKMLSVVDEESRHAAFLISELGCSGKELMLKGFALASDPFIRVQIALGLVYLEKNKEPYLSELSSFLDSYKGPLMWKQDRLGGGKSLVPSTLGYLPQVPNYPQLINQITRLQILGILSQNGYHDATQAFLNYLRNENGNISLYGTSLYLSEGPVESFDVVKNILKATKDSTIGLKAALILAFWGKDPDALDVLEKSFDHVDRSMQLSLLEAMGQIASTRSIPFLTKQLFQSSKRLRLVAAASLLRCVYYAE